MPSAEAQTNAGPATILLAAVRSLESCAEFLAALDSECYTRTNARLFNSTIGQHVRHTIDHYAAVAASLEGAVIDYDHRQRETPEERDRAAAIATIGVLTSRLGALSGGDLAAPVRVRLMVSAEGAEAELGSTFGRELAFATHHATHHFAMIASIAGEWNVKAPAGFGKAPSTAHYERARAGNSDR